MLGNVFKTFTIFIVQLFALLRYIFNQWLAKPRQHSLFKKRKEHIKHVCSNINIILSDMDQ